MRIFSRIALIALLAITCSFYTFADRRIGNVALRTMNLENEGVRFQNQVLFSKSIIQENSSARTALRDYTLLEVNTEVRTWLLRDKPEFLSVQVPESGRNISLMLYRVDISPGGFTLETGSGTKQAVLNEIIHYRGMVSGNPYSVVSISISDEEIMGIISDDNGNYVLGKMQNSNTAEHVIYNDKNIATPFTYECGTNTSHLVQPLSQELHKLNSPNAQSVNCVNWYYETDYDLYVNKGSVAAVNTYIQGIFNNVATLYDNDGISIALQTLFVWDVADPYTGPSTSNYLTQFGQYRTSFAGDLANLVGLSGGGGIAYVNGLCSSNTATKMGYSGISASYQNVPTYSWTVEVITHEDGHLLGSRHTHDCVWNGNNTRIDGCGPAAGYAGSGTCASASLPASGTIMSYCHLVSGVGINFNNGFGTQPTTVMLNNVNNASCLQACSPCPAPPQPGNISGASTFCGSNTFTYSIAAVSGATSYLWSIPPGWTGTSTTNSITVTTTSSGGAVSVVAINSCGNSTARTLTVTGNAAPGQIGNLLGNTTVCGGTSQAYSITSVNGATSYTWTLPSGWSGTSASNSISSIAGTSGGTVSVVANNSCGSSSPRTINVTVNNAPAQPSTITPSGGSAKVCPGNTRTYTISPVSGATSYQWTAPTGGTIISGQGTTSVNVEYNSGFTANDTIHVSAVNGCGPGAERTLVIQRNIPARPSVITGPASGVCNSAVNYSVVAANGVNYNWSFTSPGATINSGQGTNSINVTYASNAPANKVIVNASNACGTSANRNLNITTIPANPGIITGTASPCANQQGVPYSITPVQGAVNYTWSVPSGSRINDGTTTSTSATMTTSATNVTVNFKTTAGNVRVKANNSCGSSANSSLAVSFSCRLQDGLTSSINEILITPSVTSDKISVSITGSTEETYSLVIRDISGKIVYESDRTGADEINERHIDVSQLNPGIYILTAESKSDVLRARFVKN